MADNGTIRLKTNLSMIGDILKFQMEQKINSHGCCTLEGIIADGYQDNFVKETTAKKLLKFIWKIDWKAIAKRLSLQG